MDEFIEILKKYKIEVDYGFIEYHKDEIRLFYAMLVFLNEYFYIDNSFDMKKIKLLNELIKDLALEKVFKQTLGKTPSELVRETSYYYDDEVYKFVISNNLIKGR